MTLPTVLQVGSTGKVGTVTGSSLPVVAGCIKTSARQAEYEAKCATEAELIKLGGQMQKLADKEKKRATSIARISAYAKELKDFDKEIFMQSFDRYDNASSVKITSLAQYVEAFKLLHVYYIDNIALHTKDAKKVEKTFKEMEDTISDLFVQLDEKVLEAENAKKECAMHADNVYAISMELCKVRRKKYIRYGQYDLLCIIIMVLCAMAVVFPVLTYPI
jgi:intergrase/recombinase